MYIHTYNRQHTDSAQAGPDGGLRQTLTKNISTPSKWPNNTQPRTLSINTDLERHLRSPAVREGLRDYSILSNMKGDPYSRGNSSDYMCILTLDRCKSEYDIV